MLVSRDLGFSDLILIIFFFVVLPVLGLGFVVRRKWRLAVARREDIMKLAVLASEEAERAELEAAAEYGAAVSVSVSVSWQFQCAVCCCPTTTRCSRCKAVRYCSGKCQIIHWRQGHKDECCPPITISHVNDAGSDSGQKAVLGKQCEFSDDNLEIEGRCSNPIESSTLESSSFEFIFSSEVLDRTDDKIEPLVDAKATDSISENSIGSLLVGFSTSTGTNEKLVDVSDCEPILSTSDGSKGHQPSADKLEITPDVKDMELIKSLPSAFSSSLNSVNSYCSSKLKQKKSNVTAGEDHCNSAVYSDSSSTCSLDSSTNSRRPAESTASSDFWDAALDSSSSGHSSVSEDGDDILSESGSFLRSMNLSGHTNTSFPLQCSKPKTVMSCDAYPTTFRNETPAAGAASSCKRLIDVPGVSILPALNSEGSNYVANESSNDTHLLKSETFRSLSSSVSDPPPSCMGADFVPTMKSTKVETSVQREQNGLPEVARSLPNVGNGVKTSMWKVVQQFRASKIAVHKPLGFGTEVAGKYNGKMIFPYELFIKLYNSEKLEFRPFGLINCGNSCYANAVLQCLAFTLPLTAYLLQGLHSKACPKKEWCFTCKFENLILKAKEGKSPLSPVGILSQIQSSGSHLGCGREEDAHEFLRYAIDAMQSVCLKEAGVNAIDQMAEGTTLVGLIFGGYLQSKIKCMKCQGKSERHEQMMDLTVEIQGDIGTLEEALAEFTATETLDGENKYHCGRCKSYEKAKKKLTIMEAPNVLTIVLKRFQSGKFGKLNKLVKFPEMLNLAPYMSDKSDKSPIYRLYAVVVHLDVMNAAFSGHYVCYVKNFQGKWFKIDDSSVKPVELERVLSKGAYMLLYARLSPRPPRLIRKSMVSSDSKMRSRGSEADNNSGNSTTSKLKINMVPSTGPAKARRVTEVYPPWMTMDGAASFESFDSDEGRFHLMNRIHEVESLSDNSSLFSCSDEGSCSTESTRDSTSTEDFSDYIFGERGCSWNSPRVSSDSDGSSSSPFVNLKRHEWDSPETSGYQANTTGSVPEADGFWIRPPQGSCRKEHLQGKGNPPLSHSDTTKNCRKLTSRCSSGSRCNNCRETDLKKLSRVKPFDFRSGVSLRRPIRERTAQTFY